MKKLALYQYNDEEGKLVLTPEPKSLTSAQLFYLLTADDDCYLYNQKQNRCRHSIIAPGHLVNDWQELQRKKERDK